MNLLSLSTILEILEKHGMHASKRFGQNFLIDQDTLDSIVEAAEITKADHVIEVGPGLGVLTNELLKEAKQVTSIELDKKLIPILEEQFGANKKFTLKNQDALTFSPPSTPYKVVANIPYNITSPLLNHFLRAANPPTSLTLLVQKEVAKKICETKKHSILSLQVALFADSKNVKKVSNECFYPIPKVDSAIIHLETHGKIQKDQALAVLKLAKVAFSQKRKKLSNTLPAELLEKSTIDPNRRPQTLSIEEWQTLIKIY
jgi:16S rRNA (adenine1518-N6/adenine1519-N6)-dimethyltransferase